jgi:hypothetical protein
MLKFLLNICLADYNVRTKNDMLDESTKKNRSTQINIEVSENFIPGHA